MSEYQVYEFRAIDRPLTAKQQEELGELSSRAEITSRSFTNEYSYGDFRGDPDELMKHYFDAHLYMANWGSNRLMLRLPRGAVDESALAAYLDTCEECGLTRTDKHLIVNMEAHTEGGHWIDTDGVLDDLLPLREQLLAGDLRCLYLAWLADVHGMNSYSDDEAMLEPPVPPGLGQLDETLEAFAEFLFLDEDLLSAAAEASAPLGKRAKLDIAALKTWLSNQPAAQKDEWLAEMLASDDLTSRRRILAEYRRSTGGPKPKDGGARRTLGEIRKRVETAEQRREAAEEAKREAERQEAARRRSAYLDSLVGQEERLWREIQTLVDSKKPASYDEAVRLLLDLRDVGERTGQASAFAARLEQLAALHVRKGTFIERLVKAGMRER